MCAIRTILHPTDLSESARPALRLAQNLAREHGARLVVLNVFCPPVVYGEMGVVMPLPEVAEQLMLGRRVQLEDYVADSGAELLVEQGMDAPEILRHARELACDLIVMGTHGRGGVARALLGSVATEVLRHAPCPVLAVRSAAGGARPGVPPGTAGDVAASRPLFPVILHPTDFSEGSRRAFDIACMLARGGGRLIVLHVEQVVHVASEEYEGLLEERLRGFESDDPTVRVEHKLREGDLAVEILGEASASSCDLIALGTHGRTGLERILMGSVAEAVLRHAGCPVLVVKAPVHAASPEHPASSATALP